MVLGIIGLGNALYPDMKIFWLLLLSGAVRGQCPEDLADIPNAAFSPSAGCVWADSDESQGFDNYEEAIARCRLVLSLILQTDVRLDCTGRSSDPRVGW